MILKYLLEIRNRMLLIFITWLTLFIMCYLYKEVLLFYLIEFSIKNNTNVTFYFIFTDVTEIFYVYLKLSIFISFQITIIYFMYHILVFLVPALFYKEYKYIIYMSKTCFLVWIMSIILINYILTPLTWNFFLSFQNSESFVNLSFEAKLSEYFDFYTSIFYLSIFYLQTFTILFMVLIYTNVNFNNIKKFRKIYYYFFVLISTIISPPDVISQIIISIITIIIYELLILNLIFNVHLNK